MNRTKNSDGDWVCVDSKCANLNFARRNSCNRCGKEKSPSSESKKKQGGEIGKAAAEKSHGLFSADDWQCTKCCNVNWARRQTCNMCNSPKFGELEERTGYGGGFNEREGVEYVKREESDDDEFDAFGRKKKKFRRISESSASDNTKEIIKPSDKSKNEGQEINESKNDDDDDEDEDDDGDLSKYDLWGDDDEEEGEEAPKESKDKIVTATSGDFKDNSLNRCKSPSLSRSRSRSSSSSSYSSSSKPRQDNNSRSSNSGSRSPSSKKVRRHRSRSHDRQEEQRGHQSRSFHSRSSSRSRSRSDSRSRRVRKK